MKTLTFWDIQLHIKKKEIRSLYLFTSSENFLKKNIEESLKEHLVSKQMRDFNYDLFYAEDASLDKVLDSLSTKPLLSEKRLVILKNADKFSGYEKKFIPAIKKIPQYICCVLETNKEVKDKFIRKLAQIATVVEFSPLKESDISNWIVNYAGRFNKKITRPAAELLVHRIGFSLENLAKALERICLYVGDKNTITEENIVLLTGEKAEESKFEILNAICDKKLDRALDIISSLSREGRNAADLIGLINWQLKRIESVKKLTLRKLNQSGIAARLKMSPYAVKKVQRQSARFSMNELEENFKLLLEADLSIKQGLASPLLILETLLVRLCRKQ